MQPRMGAGARFYHQPLMPDPFDTLGLPPIFDLTGEQVRAAWRRKSALAHPDAAGQPEAGDEGARRRESALLNESLRTLEDPERRADALVVRLGGPTREQEKALPTALLAEFMEARETLEAARASGDTAALEASRRWAHERRAAHIERVRALFAGHGAPADAAALRAIRVELNAWRYVERMLEQIDEVNP